jgi:hypothetical protein
MATRIRSPVHYVGRVPLLSLLGVDQPASALPARVSCPICRTGRLTIFPDGAQAVWCHCSACQFAGDVLQLMVKAWNLKLPQAVDRLAASGVVIPDEVRQGQAWDDYERRVLWRQQVEEFWRTSKPYLWQEYEAPDISLLLQTLKIHSKRAVIAWPESVGSLFGAANRLQVESLFHPESTAYRQENGRSGHGAGRNRLFRGPGWRNILVMPFYDMPGRICGFLFAGRNANAAAGDIFYRAVDCQSNGQRIQEAGLAMLPLAMTSQQPNDTIYVMREPFVALQLQVRAYRQGEMPLPIVASYEDGRHATQDVWSILRPRPLVFCAEGIDGAFIRQARHADRNISMLYAPNQFGAPQMPSQVLKACRKRAVSWRDALQQNLRDCDAAGADCRRTQRPQRARSGRKAVPSNFVYRNYLAAAGRR